MMTDSLGDTNVHIISRVDGSGTERRRRDYLRSSEFVACYTFQDPAHGEVHDGRAQHGQQWLIREAEMVVATSQTSILRRLWAA